MVAINATIGQAGRNGQASSVPLHFAKPRATHQFSSAASNTALSFTGYSGEVLTIQVNGSGTVKIAVEEDEAAAAPDATSAYDWVIGSNIGQNVLELMVRVDGTRFAIADN